MPELVVILNCVKLKSRLSESEGAVVNTYVEFIDFCVCSERR